MEMNSQRKPEEVETDWEEGEEGRRKGMLSSKEGRLASSFLQSDEVE